MPAIPTFGTVLVNRKANERPKEWELQLRPICQKIRVVENLLGGPHLMVTGSPSVAVRIYSAEDASRLEGIASDSNDSTSDVKVDGLRNFRDKYEHSVVIFVLPTGQQQRDQLGRHDSFVNAAQRALLSDEASSSGNDGEKKHATRTVIVIDTSQVLVTIDSVVKSLLPEKREKRRKYFAQVGSQNFLPGRGTQNTQEVIADHVTKTFNAWAERFEMPDGDSAVVLSVLGSLANVTTADMHVLDEVPIRNASKELIIGFFAHTKAVEEEMEAQSYQDEFNDDLDDSELLKCPDPSTLNAVQQSERTPFPPRYYHGITNQSLVRNHQSFSGNVPFNFTPMVPQQQPGHRSTSSIFPGSFSPHGQFSHTLTKGDLSNSDIFPLQHGMHHNHRPPQPGSRGENYSFNVGNDGINGFHETDERYGGYYHTQQFM